MSITNTPTGAAEQNSVMNGLIGQVAERFSSDAERVQSDLGLDGIFTLLESSRRRAVIRLLSDIEDEITISELAERLAAAEENVDRSDLSDAARKRVHVSCCQNHLPKLEECGVLSVEDDQSVVTPSKKHSALMAVLKRISAIFE